VYAYVVVNGYVSNHLIEDATAIAFYTIEPPEPDVGFFYETIVFDCLANKKGKILTRITKHLDQQTIDDIIEQIIN
jgi:hypothetical protein